MNMTGQRDIHTVRTVDENGIPHYTNWIESRCGTYYQKFDEKSNFSSQGIQEAQWDLMHGRMTPDAQEVAKYPLTATDPWALMK
jgi:hypothetical protein